MDGWLTLFDVEYTPHGGDVTCSGCGVLTGKIIKIASMFLKEENKRENLLQNSILDFVFRLRRSSAIALESKNSLRRKTTFMKSA